MTRTALEGSESQQVLGTPAARASGLLTIYDRYPPILLDRLTPDT